VSPLLLSLLAALLIACGPRPQPIVYLPAEPSPSEEGSIAKTETATAVETAATAATPKPVEARPKPAGATPKPPDPVPTSSWSDYQVPTLPMHLALHRGMLVWADVAGAMWTMPANGSRAPEQISEQHRDGFASHPFVAGDRLIAKSGKGLLAIDVPGGAVTQVRVTGVPDLLEDIVGDASMIFFTVFEHDQVMRVPVTGGVAQKVLSAKHAVLALHGPTLYVASFSTGDLFAVSTAGGAARTIARRLKQPTALAVDDTAAYVYTEGDQRLIRVELATGATQVLGEHLENSDEVDLAADAIYTVSWPSKLVRLPKVSGGEPVTLTDQLFQPRGIVRDEQFIYVTSDKPPRIVRVPAR
jgi:hypothetical protein